MRLNYLNNQWPSEELFDEVIQGMQKCRINLIDPDIQIANGLLDEVDKVIRRTDNCVLFDIDLFQLIQDVPEIEERAPRFFKQWFDALDAFCEKTTGLRYAYTETNAKSVISNMLDDLEEEDYHAFLSIKNVTFLCDVFHTQEALLTIREMNCSMFFSANIQLDYVEQSAPHIGNSLLSTVTKSATVVGHEACTDQYAKAYEDLKATLSDH